LFTVCKTRRILQGAANTNMAIQMPTSRLNLQVVKKVVKLLNLAAKRIRISCIVKVFFPLPYSASVFFESEYFCLRNSSNFGSHHPL
jgi:hypothetical protein